MWYAAMAQLVEHILGKDEVPSSNLGSSSRKTLVERPGLLVFLGLLSDSNCCPVASLQRDPVLPLAPNFFNLFLYLLIIPSSARMARYRKCGMLHIPRRHVELTRKRQGVVSSPLVNTWDKASIRFQLQLRFLRQLYF